MKYVQSLNNALDEMMKADKTIYLLGEDIRDPYGGAFKVTKGLSTKHGERVVNTPISESGIVGVATGMSLRGLKPIVEIMFGDFMTLTVDQIISNLSKMRWMYNDQVKTPVVIRTPMGGRRCYGPTHSQSLEKMFLGIPGVNVVAPSVFHDPGELLKQAVHDEDPVIFIEYKLDYAAELKVAHEGMCGPWHYRRQGAHYPTVALSMTNFNEDQLTLITYGGMASYAEKAARQLMHEEEVAVQILVISQLSGFDEPMEVALESLKRTGKAVVVEEGTLTSGWGAEVSARLASEGYRSLRAPIKRVASKDSPIGNTKALEDHILPDEEDIVAAVKELL